MFHLCHNGAIIFEIYIMKKSSPLNLKITFFWHYQNQNNTSLQCYSLVPHIVENRGITMAPLLCPPQSIQNLCQTWLFHKCFVCYCFSCFLLSIKWITLKRSIILVLTVAKNVNLKLSGEDFSWHQSQK